MAKPKVGSALTKKQASTDPGLGERIRARRKSIGMTQAALASAIGVSFQQVQKYEKGISAVSRGRLQQICEIMKLPPEFFDGDGTNYIGKPAPLDDAALPSAEAVERFLASGEGQRLVHSFLTITDRKLRTRILDFIASVATDRPI